MIPALEYSPPPAVVDPYLAQAEDGSWTIYERSAYPSADAALARDVDNAYGCVTAEEEWPAYCEHVDELAVRLGHARPADPRDGEEPGWWFLCPVDHPHAIEVWVVTPTGRRA